MFVYKKHRQNPVLKRNYKTQGWKFEGTVDEFNLKVFCKEENIVFDDFIKIKATFLLMHKHPTVFETWDNG